jgi:hypothetical protein
MGNAFYTPASGALYSLGRDRSHYLRKMGASECRQGRSGLAKSCYEFFALPAQREKITPDEVKFRCRIWPARHLLQRRMAQLTLAVRITIVKINPAYGMA